MENNNKCKLKEGDKVYRILYYSWGDDKPERKWSSFTVKEVKRNRIYLKGYTWSFSVSDLGVNIFKSKIEAIKNTLKNINEDIKPIQKEIKYLEKKLLELKKVY